VSEGGRTGVAAIENRRFWFYAAVEHDATHRQAGRQSPSTATGPVVPKSALIQRDDAQGTHSGKTSIDRVHGRRRPGRRQQCYIAGLKPT
jgi:hypothetical protein